MVKEVRVVITDAEADPVELTYTIIYYDSAGNLAMSDPVETDVDELVSDLGNDLSTNSTTYGITDDIT